MERHRSTEAARRPGTRRPGPAHLVTGEEGFGLVEVIISLALFTVAMVGLAGMSVLVADQTRAASARTDEVLVAQQELERVIRDGYFDAASGVETETVGGRTYTVTRTVTQIRPTVKEIRVEVTGPEGVNPYDLVTRLHRPRTLPSSP